MPQARNALLAQECITAVVVDDLFTPLGLVTLKDIEAELVRQALLGEEDPNFSRPS